MTPNPITRFQRSLNYDTPPGLEVAAGSQGKIVRLSGQWTALALARDKATGHVIPLLHSLAGAAGIRQWDLSRIDRMDHVGGQALWRVWGHKMPPDTTLTDTVKTQDPVALALLAILISLVGAIALCPPSALHEPWSRRFPDPLTCFASGWMRVRARARQRGVELPLVISDHADWDGLTSTIDATGAGEIWVTHGQEDALVHWCAAKGLTARPLDLVGYGDEDEGDGVPASEDSEA